MSAVVTLRDMFPGGVVSLVLGRRVLGIVHS